MNFPTCPKSPVIYVINKLEPLLHKLVTQPTQVGHINRRFKTRDGYSGVFSFLGNKIKL